MENIDKFLLVDSQDYLGINFDYYSHYGSGSACGSGFVGMSSGSGSSYEFSAGNGRISGDGYDSGYGYGSGTGDGYGSGDGTNLKMINGNNIYLIDNLATIITSVIRNVAKGYILNSDLTQTPCFVIKSNNMFAHGATIKEAQKSLEDKIIAQMSIEDTINLFLKKFPDKKKKYPVKLFYDWHNKLTGSCEMGRKAFAKNHNIDIENDKMSVIEFIEITKNKFGGEIIKQLKNIISERKI